MGEHRRAGVHPPGEPQRLQGSGYRVGAIVALKGRENRERLVRMPGHQVAGHLQPREVIAVEACGI